jgi:hypothetical protein
MIHLCSDIVPPACPPGRGPLVRASLRAAAAAGRKVKVYAVEKNPCAVVHIQTMVARQGLQDQVTIVHADMRAWQVGPEGGGKRRGSNAVQLQAYDRTRQACVSLREGES